MILLFLGPPGSGKGTQAQKLKASRGWPQLSTGDLFRENVAARSKLGLQVEGILRRGELVPDSLVVALVEDRTRRPDCSGGYILDGFPRTIAQADALQEMLKARGQRVAAAVLFEIGDSQVVDRMSSRRTCKKCGQVTSVALHQACPKCGSSELSQRDDDLPATILRRLDVYKSQTQPLVHYYEEERILRRVDASQSPDLVEKSLARLVGELEARGGNA